MQFEPLREVSQGDKITNLRDEETEAEAQGLESEPFFVYGVPGAV